jgi:hypothetical protein
MLTAIFERGLAEAEQRRRVVQLRREELESLRRLRRVEDVKGLCPTGLGDSRPWAAA